MCISDFGEKWFNTGKMQLEATTRYEYPLQRSLATCYISIKHGLLIAGTSMLWTFYCSYPLLSSSCSGRLRSAIRAKDYIVQHACCYSISPSHASCIHRVLFMPNIQPANGLKNSNQTSPDQMAYVHSSLIQLWLHHVFTSASLCYFCRIDLNRTRCSVFQHLRHVLSSCAFCEAALFDYLQPVRQFE